MGIELEYKLAVPTPALLEQILFDRQVAQVRTDGYRLQNMATVYYDTPDGRLRARHWTLRLRQEDERMVATLKTPAQGRARGEWECPAYTIREAVPLLLEAGAPAELAELLEGQTPQPLCVAQFSRRSAGVAFADGTVCELCGDVGALAGGGKEEALCEIEVELKQGDPETAAAFAAELCERFGLQEQPLSKFARAAALAAK